MGPRLSRRRFMITAGAGTLGVAVLSACSSSPSETTDSSVLADPSAPANSAAPAAGRTAADGWHRVDMSFVSAYLLIRRTEVAVVDTGKGGSADAIEYALKAAGTGWDAVRHVILTHNHSDHAGGLSSIPDAVTAAYYAGEADVNGIFAPSGPKPLKDGDEVFGLRVVATPGHTAGHISIFDAATGTLVAGDALRTAPGLVGSDPQFTADAAQAAASVRKLARLDVKAILPGHGEPLTAGAAEALRKLAAQIS